MKKGTENYCKLKTNIRNQSKTKIKQIANEQKKGLPKQERKEGKEDFLRKIASNSGILGANAISKHEACPPYRM